MLFKQQKQNGDLTTKYLRFILYNGDIPSFVNYQKNGDYPELSQIMRLIESSKNVDFDID